MFVTRLRRVLWRDFDSISANVIEKLDPKTLTGNAINNTPQNIHNMEKNLPAEVVGYISPYPTVVTVTQAQYKAAGIETKGEGADSPGVNPGLRNAPSG